MVALWEWMRRGDVVLTVAIAAVLLNLAALIVRSIRG
jgi:hypothetical protein